MERRFPRIDDLLDQLRGGKKCFLLSMWHIPMDPESKDKTAFITPDDLM